MSRSTQNDSDNCINAQIKSTSELDGTWKAAPSQWGHSLHSFAPYVGGFPPELAHYFIERYTEPGDVILDPMCGGGTAPLEAALQNRRGWGNDRFAYAYTLTGAKCNPLDDTTFKAFLDDKLMAAESVSNRDHQLLENEDLYVFYSDYTLDKLLRLREILQDDDSIEATYLKAIICGILHGPSDMYVSLQTKDTYPGSVNYVRRYAERNDLDRPEKEIRPNAITKHHRAQEDRIPEGLANRTNITQTDVRRLSFPSESVELIVTSPPYMAKLDYTWDNWLRLWWLGVDRDEERDSLDLTQDVTKYLNFISEALKEMYRVLKPDSRAVLIVGDVSKRLADGRRTINTARLIADEATKIGNFEPQTVLEDSYNVDDRRYVVFNQLKYDYDDTDKEDMAMIDRCLILEKGDPPEQEPPQIDW